ncbi:Minor fimbrial protein prsF precursor [Pragia fontium]|uniref:Pilin (Type 1 fimbria component protein) n=1 Tax=Pragia fontium DSM 5563 = ATCC 49100 TaxID=1122977 RepID=A0AAJ5BFU6_9GAMM|nr:fimbrial protein [Pragia fontium]SFC05180.1 Pilin (type 1 fimbria component protein) [Pragia fontium DSM 5563 = ATCC 49100]SUB81546.1 Minor fimbrial protein prsF precursor [Pragia fontium]
MRNGWRYGLGLLSLMLASAAVQADVPVTVSAVIVAPVCQVTGVNGQSQLEMRFDDVLVQHAGTAKAERSVGIKVNCTAGAPAGKSLKMYLTPTAYGVMRNMGSNVLSTSMTEVGIALTYNKNPLNIGQWLPIQAGFFTLTGQVVIPDGITVVEGGEFSAGASLFASYM